MENRENIFTIPTLISFIGIVLITIAFLFESHYYIAFSLSLLALFMFVVSFFLNRKLKEGNKVSQTINMIAFIAFIINIIVFLGMGAGTEDSPRKDIGSESRECVSKLKFGKKWKDSYEEGSKYIPVAPSYYFYMRGTVTPSDGGLDATGYVFGKAWYVFWTRWGDVDLKLTSTVICEGECNGEINKCLTDISTKGNSSRQESIVRGVMDVAATASGNRVKAIVAFSGSLSADGGPTISVGKDPLKLSISWPNSTAENTFQAGTYKWKCECLPNN